MRCVVDAVAPNFRRCIYGGRRGQNNSELMAAAESHLDDANIASTPLPGKRRESSKAAISRSVFVALHGHAYVHLTAMGGDWYFDETFV